MFRLITLANRSVARVQSARDASVARRGLFMSYVDSVLQPGERIIMRGHLHWIVYWHAILFLVLGVVVVAWESSGGMGDGLISFTAIAFGTLFVISFLVAWFNRWITEIAVTDRRVIYKRGFITRHTV